MSKNLSARILFLVNDDRFFVTHRLPLAREILKTGAEVIVAAPPGKFRGEIEKAGFVFQPVRFSRASLNPFRELLTFLEVVKAYRKFRPQLVHQITLKPIIYGTWAARIAGAPAVVNAITGLGYAFAGTGFKRAVLRKIAEWGYRQALKGNNNRTIFQNPDDRSLFITKNLVNPSTATVIEGSGVDPEKYHPQPEPAGGVTILFASRMLWDKGAGDLVAAARILRKENLQFQVVLAGVPDPANPASIPESQLQEWQNEGIVIWVGHKQDMVALLGESHIFCLPSYYREGVPMALLEAAASGRPIVTTDTPGCRETVEDGMSGFLVPPKNPARLADALKKLILDASLRKKMGTQGRKNILKHFTLDTVVERTVVVYRDLLGS